jgi:hypothetical protein
MILIGSGALLTIGLLMLLWQAIVISYHLLKIAYHLLTGAVCLVVLVVCCIGLAIQYIFRWLKPHPAEPYFYSDAEDVPTIELPRDSFHRVRG